MKKFVLVLAAVSLVGSHAVAADAIEAEQYLQKKEKSKDARPASVVSMYCGVYNNTRVQITYNNPSNNNYTCSSTCYYSINNGPTTALSCTATAVARTTGGFFCGTNPYNNVRVTNAGSNNCP